MTSVVHPWGLFLASDLSAPVLLSMVGSVMGLGVRPCAWSKLAALWDVPILISDRLSNTADTALLCVSACRLPLKSFSWVQTRC